MPKRPFPEMPDLSIDVADITNEIVRTKELKHDLKVPAAHIPHKRVPLSKRKLN